MTFDWARENYVDPFRDLDYDYVEGVGIIVWRAGTGGNVELLHVRAAEIRRGHGRRLFYRMLRQLEESPPYHSIFGFTRVSNHRAREFYAAMGFDLTPVPHVYADGSGIMFSQSFARLLEVRRAYEDSLRR